MSTIKTTSLGPIGVEVHLDLSQSHTRAEQARLQQLRGQHHMLLFRNQSLTLERQIEVMGYFGPVLTTPGDGVGYVSNVRLDGILGDGELSFHSDLDFSPRGAYHALSLHAVDVDDDATSTEFASAALAYRRLPDALRERITSLEALDVQLKDLAGRNRVATIDPDTPRLVHPMVRRLPVTREPALWTSVSGTDSVIGLPADESDALLEEIFDVLYDPAWLYSHRWRTGDILVWDNQALQHRRDAIPPGVRRTLQRVTGADPHSGFFEVFPQFAQSDYATR